MGTQCLGALTAKAGCSAVPWKAVGWRKAFLKGMEARERPKRGMLCSPLSGEQSRSTALASPRWQGS